MVLNVTTISDNKLQGFGDNGHDLIYGNIMDCTYWAEKWLKPQSVQLVSKPQFTTGTFQARNWNAAHYIVMLNSSLM